MTLKVGDWVRDELYGTGEIVDQLHEYEKMYVVHFPDPTPGQKLNMHTCSGRCPDGQGRIFADFTLQRLNRFRIGDRVIYRPIDYGSQERYAGIIRKIAPYMGFTQFDYAIELDEKEAQKFEKDVDHMLHSCQGFTPSKRGWWAEEKDLVPLKEGNNAKPRKTKNILRALLIAARP